eukprot:symbB.v1.2.031836.t1/scaffold3734.1/size51279/1
MTEPTARAMNLPAVMPNVLKLQTIKEDQELQTVEDTGQKQKPSLQALVDRRTFRRNAETTTGESAWSQALKYFQCNLYG